MNGLSKVKLLFLPHTLNLVAGLLPSVSVFLDVAGALTEIYSKESPKCFILKIEAYSTELGLKIRPQLTCSLVGGCPLLKLIAKGLKNV